MLNIQRVVEGLAKANVKSGTEDSELFRHIYRELNAEADQLAGQVESGWYVSDDVQLWTYLRLFFDGMEANIQ